MLRELQIENLALIDKLTLDFGPGLNVLTGETGAGKSIIVGAANLLLGRRASQEFLRSGRDRGAVTGVFEVNDRTRERLEQFEIPDLEEGTVLLSREISRNEKNICRVNDRAVTLSTLREVGSRLVDIYGQSEHQSLLVGREQLSILDHFGGEELQRQKREVAARSRELQSLRRRIDEAENALERARQESDFMQYQLQQIDGARLQEGEEEELADTIRVLSGAEILAEGSAKVHRLLFEGGEDSPAAYDLLNEALSEVEAMRKFDVSLQPQLEALRQAVFLVEDAAGFFRDYGENVESDPERKQLLEDRLSLINQLKNKFRKSVAEILGYRAEIAASLESLQLGDEKLKQLKKDRETAESEYYAAAERLSVLRREVAETLDRDVCDVLHDLEMKEASFKITILPRETPGELGMDEALYVFSANPGEPLMPLEKIASGGELSRLMLALKSVLAAIESVPVLIFDEVDAGVGGYTAHKLGQRVALLSGLRQVICVTHSPQMAAFADVHYGIEKETRDGRTITSVLRLDEEGHVHEVARMLGGKEYETAVKHAKKMISVAREFNRNQAAY